MASTSKKNKEFSIDSLVSKDNNSTVDAVDESRNIHRNECYLPKPEPQLGSFFSPNFPSSVSHPHPAFMGASTTLNSGQGPLILPPIHGILPHSTSMVGTIPHLSTGDVRSNHLLQQGLVAGHHSVVHPNGIQQSSQGLPNKDNFPFYTWLLARHSSYMNHGYTGNSFLLSTNCGCQLLCGICLYNIIVS